MTTYTLKPPELGGQVDLAYQPHSTEQRFSSRSTTLRVGDHIKAGPLDFEIVEVCKHFGGLREGVCKCRNQ